MEKDFDIVQFLRSAVASGASDEHLKVGISPFLRINGFIKKTNLAPLTQTDLEREIIKIAPSIKKENILNEQDLDFMFEIKGCSRFRVNYSKQLGFSGLVIRNIPYEIPALETLGLPDILHDLVKYHDGIILITGPTGSGKSTTLASLINEITQQFSKHIITIEDPVEYIFSCKKGIVSQRQVNIDTSSFADGIKYALRQDPDVILIGEIRDRETMAAALKASETGHLVLATLHTNDAVQTINRIINMFEEEKRSMVRRQLAETFRATVAQKLIYSKEKNKRFPACEILMITPTIKDYIIKDNMEEIYRLINDTNIDNLMSFNTSLVNLVSNGCISEEEALEYSNDEEALKKIFRGVYQGTKVYYE